MSESRSYSPLDNLLLQADKVLQTLASAKTDSTRPSPAEEMPNTPLATKAAKHSAGLMRINHTGEVCAQALYQGQAATAKLADVRDAMQQAADEETDHLAWCQQRLDDLNSQTSLLNPLFYAASFGIGAAAGLAGDKWSLGFVAETERQVGRHLEEHLQKLPAEDLASKAVLEQMREDEAEHAAMAVDAGAAELPAPVRVAMTLVSKVMTKTTYHI